MSTSRPSTGIEAITVHVPEHYLTLEALAGVHGVDPAKFHLGLGCRSMAVPHPTQDTVTMAVAAVRDLIDRYNVDPEEVGLLICGTETGVDSSKPVSSYVHGLAGLGPQCRIFDIKHACYGATAGLAMACSWAHRGRKAIVVASDVSRYQPGSPGEPTQGAGAVAMLVSDRPQVFRIHDSFEAVHALSVNDFWRPTYSQTAVVDGHYSVACYLSGLRSSWREMSARTGRSRDDFAYMLYHLPFPRMSWKAHMSIAEVETGIDPASPSADLEPERLVYAQKVEPALWAAQEIGNIYTGSLWLGLAALLESEPSVCAGKLASLYSYGSGSCSELITGAIGDDPTAWHGRIGLGATLTTRTQIDHDLYLEFRKKELALKQNGSYSPSEVPLEDHLPSRAATLFLGVKDHRRVYRPGTGWKPGTDRPRVQIREDEPPEAWCDMWMLGQEPPWKVQ